MVECTVKGRLARRTVTDNVERGGCGPVRWEDLFADLEAQAESWERAERDAEVADRTRAEVGQLGLVSRLRANEGRQLSLRLLGGIGVSGVLNRLGVDWLLLADTHELVVPLAAVATVANLPLDTTSPQGAGVVASRLTLSSVLRAIARDRARVTVTLRDQTTVSGTPDRVGRDFVDLAVHHEDTPPRVAEISMRTTIAVAAISVVTRDRGTWG
jgi:hypothetical protein